MTRKHYKQIAEMLANLDECVAQDDLRIIAESLADIMREDNPRFDRDKFLTACGL